MYRNAHLIYFAQRALCDQLDLHAVELEDGILFVVILLLNQRVPILYALGVIEKHQCALLFFHQHLEYQVLIPAQWNVIGHDQCLRRRREPG